MGSNPIVGSLESPAKRGFSFLRSTMPMPGPDPASILGEGSRARRWTSAFRPLRQRPHGATALLLLPLISSAGTGPERAELDDQPLARRGTSQLERLAGGLERGGRPAASNTHSFYLPSSGHRCPFTCFFGRPA